MQEALEWVLRVKNRYGIRVLNISVGIGDLKERYKEQMLRKSLELLWDHNILVVCAAGNTGPEDGSISEMASSRKVLTVGCHDGRYCKNDPGRCETYSGRGRRYDVTRKPDIVAPGTRILSCNAFWQNRNGRIYRPYVAKSGTSMATPIVSGAAALVMEKYPQITNEEFVRLLSLTATDLGEPWNKQGFGMLNVRRLLENK
jgi:serine protease AprX